MKAKHAWKPALVLLLIAMGRPASADQPLAQDLNRVIARQGQVEVTLGQFHAAMQEVPESERATFADDPERLTLLVRQLIRINYLASEAERENALPIFLEQRVLASRNKLLAEHQAQRIRDSIEVPDLTAAARERYLTKRADYVRPRSAQVRYIALSIPKRGEVEARELAIDLSLRAQKGEDFDALLTEFSDEEEREGRARGLIAAYPLADKPSPEDALGQVLVDLEPGQVSRPFKEKTAYYVARLVDVAPARQLEFDEVKERIVEEIRSEFLTARFAERSSAYETTPMQLDEEVMPLLRDHYLKSGAGSQGTELQHEIRKAIQ